ncbi:MAG: M56 family metallopeptidase, partial [Pirellulaceae bacterium]
ADAHGIREASLLCSESLRVPVAVGVIRPAIVLPVGYGKWSDDRLHVVLLHEMMHVGRADVLAQTVAGLACTLFWFNPLVWRAASRMRLERELASDDSVLLAGEDAVDYADHLVEIAATLSRRLRLPAAATAMSTHTNLHSRVARLTQQNVDRSQVSRPLSIMLLLSALLVITCLTLATPAIAMTTDEPPATETINDDTPADVATVPIQDTESNPANGAGDRRASLAPPADPEAQKLGEAVHRQLTAIDSLKSMLISTRSFTSYYGDPKGVIGLKDERSLEHLRAALEKRDFDRSLSTQEQVWAWDGSEVVATEHHKYLYEGEPYDQKSSRTWDGKQGWWHDGPNRFGRYRSFDRTFQNHYFKPSKFLHLGDHTFNWVKQDGYLLNSLVQSPSSSLCELPSLARRGILRRAVSVIRSVHVRNGFGLARSRDAYEVA